MAKTRGPSAKAYYAAYKSQNRFATNRKRKLERLLKQHPNNKQIAEALKNIKYRRKTPGTSTWLSSMRKTAGLFKEFTGKMNMNVFNTNPDVRVQAVSALKSNKTATQEKVSFKLGDRAHDKNGALVWK